MKIDSFTSMPAIMITLYLLVAAILFVKLNWIIFGASVGSGLIAHILIRDTRISVPAAILVLILLAFLLPKDGFKDKVAKHKIAKHKVARHKVASHSVEGYEDVKKAKDETPAPAPKKEGLPMPFTLGEIPSQVKNGPHIDASSTLMNVCHPSEKVRVARATQSGGVSIVVA